MKPNLGHSSGRELLMNYVCVGLVVSDISNMERRERLYDKMAKDLDEHGAVFLKGGETSQSLLLSDIFTLKDGVVTPVLKVICNLLVNLFCRLNCCCMLKS